MVIVTHESYDSVLIGTGKQKGFESIHHNCQFEGDTFWDTQPVKADRRWGMCFACDSPLSVIVWPRTANHLYSALVPNLGV